MDIENKFVEQYCASVGHNVVMEIVSKKAERKAHALYQ